jgi:predicted dehydrogenase
MIKFGVLGPGHIAESFAAAAKISKGELYAVASRDLKKAEKFKNKFGFKKAYGSYEAMMKDKNVNCVYIATPHSHHYEHMLLALKYNKHIISEKAFTVNAKQAKEVIKIANKKKLFVMEMTKMRFSPLLLEIKKVIDDGKYGKIKRIDSSYCQFIDTKRVERLINPKLAGGALLDLAIYNIALVNMFLGKPKSFTSQVKFYKTGVDRAETITYQYKDAIAVMESSSDYEKDHEAIITLEKAVIKLPIFSRPEIAMIYDNKKKLLVTLKSKFKVNSLEHEIIEAVRCIEAKKQESPLLTHKQTIEMMTQMDNIRKSWKLKYPME